jgi:hypothetical protein
MCAKFGSDRFRNVNLYKFHTYIQTNKQIFFFIYKICESGYQHTLDSTVPVNRSSFLPEITKTTFISIQKKMYSYVPQVNEFDQIKLCFKHS